MSSTSNEQFSVDLISRCKLDQLYFLLLQICP